jgi:hypothetical protein
VPVIESRSTDVDSAEPVPEEVRHTICVAVDHDVVGHAVSPIVPCRDKSTAPKLLPKKDRYVPPLAGVFGNFNSVTIGLSNENAAEKQPTFAVITFNVSLPPVPFAVRHRMVVPVLHEVVLQVLKP